MRSLRSLFAPPAPAPVVRGETAPDPSALISLHNIEKWVPASGGPVAIRRRISFDVAPGEFVSIMGPSGAGKSTLLAVLGMLDAGWNGEYFFTQQAVHALRLPDRVGLNKRHIGFVFQQYHLIDDMTVAENLDVPLSYRDVPKPERAAIVADALDRFQMGAKKDLFPRQLSGGQQQLVAIARAMIAKPSLILADEPTGNLHSTQGREIMEIFRSLNEAGTTIIQVTHSEENAGYGGRVVRLKDGWLE